MNIQDAAIQILKKAGKALHAKDITKRIIEAGLWKSDGKTPEATVSSRLYSDIKKRGGLSTFVKVAPQTFSLRDTQPAPVYDDAKAPKSKIESASTKPKKTIHFWMQQRKY